MFSSAVLEFSQLIVKLLNMQIVCKLNEIEAFTILLSFSAIIFNKFKCRSPEKHS